jgi:hypothetical protein
LRKDGITLAPRPASLPRTTILLEKTLVGKR